MRVPCGCLNKTTKGKNDTLYNNGSSTLETAQLAQMTPQMRHVPQQNKLASSGITPTCYAEEVKRFAEEQRNNKKR